MSVTAMVQCMMQLGFTVVMWQLSEIWLVLSQLSGSGSNSLNSWKLPGRFCYSMWTRLGMILHNQPPVTPMPLLWDDSTHFCTASEGRKAWKRSWLHTTQAIPTMHSSISNLHHFPEHEQYAPAKPSDAMGSTRTCRVPMCTHTSHTWQASNNNQTISTAQL